VRRWALAPVVLLLAGCAQMGYLSQSLGGHLSLLAAARPVDEVLADPALKPALRERLILSQQLREFAVSKLHLPDNRSYRSYADLQRPAAVWNVVAAPPLSLQARNWCFPVMGCVAYRGYFERAAAQAYAEQLQREEGLEVAVVAVPAYSTLGWSNAFGGDPLLNTFIQYPEGELAGLLFHELAHQVAYAADDTTFNESFATAVERLGARAWLQGRPGPAEGYERGQQRRRQFRALTEDCRAKLAAVYAGAADEPGRQSGKAAVMNEFRAAYARLKAEEWAGYAGYDDWVARANNASFALLAAYGELSPAFEALFERMGADWPRFYAEVQVLAALPKVQRRARLLQVQTQP